MAWNPSPKVAKARDIGKEYNKKIVLIIMIDDETQEIISYGGTKLLCKEADILGEQLSKTIYDFYDKLNNTVNKGIELFKNLQGEKK